MSIFKFAETLIYSMVKCLAMSSRRIDWTLFIWYIILHELKLMKINFNSRHTMVYVKQRGLPPNQNFCSCLVHHFSMMIYNTPVKNIIPFSRIAAGRPVWWLKGEAVPVFRLAVDSLGIAAKRQNEKKNDRWGDLADQQASADRTNRHSS